MKVHCQEFCNLTNILSVPMKMSVTSMPPHLIIELSTKKKERQPLSIILKIKYGHIYDFLLFIILFLFYIPIIGSKRIDP